MNVRVTPLTITVCCIEDRPQADFRVLDVTVAGEPNTLANCPNPLHSALTERDGVDSGVTDCP